MVETKTKCSALVINDADAAGIAEIKYGAGSTTSGLVMMITIGTGIGTALFNNGKLLSNSELGHVFMPRNIEAEQYASDATRQMLNLTWEEWANRLTEYLVYIENLFWPDLFILGGGISKHHENYISFIKTRTPIKIAQLFNNAGIIGSAYMAKKLLK